MPSYPLVPLDFAQEARVTSKLRVDEMKKILSFALLLLGMAGSLMAQGPGFPGAPEIDPGSAVSALVLLSGSLLVLRARRKR